MSLKERLARLAFPYGSRRRVLRGPVRGMHFVIGEGMGATYALGFEDAAPRHFATLIQRGMTVYDVGANKGQMALLFSRLVGPEGRVVSFEPAPEPFEALAENIAVSGVVNVHPHQVALSDGSGEAVFTYAPGRPTQGKLAAVEPSYSNPGASTFTVQTLRLDAVSEPAPDFIKIDVEGAGAAVLRGASGVLGSSSPGIYIELHGPEEQAGVRDELLSRGYVAETLIGERVADPTSEWKSPLWCYRPS